MSFTRGWKNSFRSRLMRSLEPTLTQGGWTRVYDRPWRTIKLEIRGRSELGYGSSASVSFWKSYETLSAELRGRADKQFALMKTNPQHPSLRFKKIGDREGHEVWSARITLKYRALAIKLPDEFLWFWIGEHGVYDELVS